jgi:hypothetical protein
MSDLMGLLISIAPVVAALMWCNVRDQRRTLAEGVRADVNAAVNRVMGGESLVAVEVEPATPWRTGQVRLRAPGGYDPLLACLSEAVLQRLPDDYELVTRPARPRG